LPLVFKGSCATMIHQLTRQRFYSGTKYLGSERRLARR